jgi:type IV fimbrial biogenesis protein FimT
MKLEGQRQRGITIVEIMVALAIASILIGLALPAWNGLIAQRTLTTQLNDLVLAVQYARSEAGRQGTIATVQAVNAGDNANEWGPGWCVVMNNPGNCGAPLRRFAATGNNTVDGTGALDGVGALSFNSRGLLTTGVGGNIDLCDPNEDTGRRITVSVIGRVSSAELDCNP